MNIKLTENAEAIINMLYRNGFKAYAVGGYVRDCVMGKAPFDVDICTNADTADMLRIFSGYKTVTKGIKHGTVGVVINNEVIECTSFRVDGKYADNRHPDFVRFTGKIEDDLKRRDFTVNALAYNQFDGFIDLFHGLDDIENKIIRAIGNPEERFKEDSLRILRGMRFACVLGFTIEENTKNAMIELCGLLKSISKERITEEVKKMLSGKNFPYAAVELGEVLRCVFPFCTISEKAIKAIGQAPESFIARLYLFIKDSSSPEKVFDALRLSSKEKECLSQLLQIKEPEDIYDIKHLLNRFGKDTTELYLRLSGNERTISLYNCILEKKLCYSKSMLDIKASDLIFFGIENRLFGRIFNSLTEMVIMDVIPNEREILIEKALSLVKNL